MQEFPSKPMQIKYQNMLCNQKNQAQFLCSTAGCKNLAFVCGKNNCKCMAQDHPNCDITLAKNIIQRILAKNEPLGKQLEKTVKAIEQIYQQSIEKLSQDLQNIRVWKDNFGLSIDQAKLINLIKQNDQNQLNGDLVSIVKANVSSKQDFSGLAPQIVQMTWKRQKSKYQKAFEKIINMVKIPPRTGKYQFQWDLQSKKPNLKINEKYISSTQNQGNTIAFISPDFRVASSSKLIKWAIKMEELSGYEGSIGVGICFRNRFLNLGMTLDSIQMRNLGNGIYLTMSSGLVLSHSNQKQNYDRSSSFTFRENDILNICYDREKRVLKIVKNNNVLKAMIFNGIQDPPSQDYYTPCIVINGKRSVIQIVSPNEDIKWDSVKASGQNRRQQQNESPPFAD